MFIVLACVVLMIGGTGFLLAPRMSGRERVHPFFGVKWAHRGLHNMKKGIPENSMKAFQAAVDAGDGIELDVHLTKDNQIVVFHDDTFERVCGKKGTVEETTYTEMKKYFLSGTKERIPLLKDVLKTVDGKVPLLIEVKLPSANTKVCQRLESAVALPERHPALPIELGAPQVLEVAHNGAGEEFLQILRSLPSVHIRHGV